MKDGVTDGVAEQSYVMPRFMIEIKVPFYQSPRIYRLNFTAPEFKENIIDGKQLQALTFFRFMTGVLLC